MKPRPWLSCAFCALALTSLIGCFSHYPGSVYGRYPGYYGPQGGTVISPGATIGTPTSALPGDGINSRASGDAWAPSGGDAPAFNPASDGVGSNAAVPSDPSYTNPKEALPPRNFEDTGRFDEGAPAPASGGVDEFGDKAFDDDAAIPFGSESKDAAPFDGAASSAPEEFSTPDVAIRPSAVRTAAGESVEPSPYKHDPENYSWLRGVVDYDENDKTWNIIYNLTPDKNDQFGGSLTLSGADKASGLRDNDVVLVEGHVDYDHLDAFGKPRFQVDNLERLVPIR